jgi:hypothetical protein
VRVCSEANCVVVRHMLFTLTNLHFDVVTDVSN